MTNLREGLVFVKNVFAGIISETTDGYRFVYDKYYLDSEKPLSVSLTMSVTDKPYESKTLFPFFDGLIPEGWLLNVIVHNWKIDEKDRFGLLLVSCRDCVGDVSVRSME
ncbi:MAG: HipA N-terminal domain-containing protein [Spirochaetales bacterium]|nr:HipA N-terminal domain-containing protein [Spirochaetales bacterium]